MPSKDLRVGYYTKDNHISRMGTKTWAMYLEAVYEAVAAEADAYHDCTPTMACLRAPDSLNCPQAVLRMNWMCRMSETCRALNQLRNQGRIRLIMTSGGWGGQHSRVYRPNSLPRSVGSSEECSPCGGMSDTTYTED